MEDFIIKLKNMLYQSGYENWNIYYFPDSENECILELDGNTIVWECRGADADGER